MNNTQHEKQWLPCPPFKKSELPLHGPHSLWFPSSRIFPPLSLRCPTMCSPPHTTAMFDLVKLVLVILQKSLFTHGGVKSSSISDPLSY